MAATETIRIVLHTQAESDLRFSLVFEASDRSDRSPPAIGVVGPPGRNACRCGPS